MTIQQSPGIIRIVILSVLLLLAVSVTSRAYGTEPYVPPSLQEWHPWVLHDKEEQSCPISYNDGQAFHCTWPSRLRLLLNPSGGHFSQEWMIFAPSWTPLPGGAGVWPDNVRLDGSPVPVSDRNGVPSIKMSPGRHRVEGSFGWSGLPETLQVPPASGLVEVTINDKTVEFPVLDRNGRLWLQQRTQMPSGEQDRMEIKVFRLISDTIPMQMTSLLKINISGRAREIHLDGVLTEKSVPTGLKSPLPARIDPAGGLTIQARPGRWQVYVIARLEGPVTGLSPPPGDFGTEIWAFQHQNHLRMVKISGPVSVDPNQTDSPPDWKEWPHYLMDRDSQLTLEVLRRGDPEPAPDRLNLHRTWWLDFNGSGLTVRDEISGTMSRNWSLAMNPPTQLGRVSVDGEDRLITAQGKEGKPGVELRQGRLNMAADSRYEGSLKSLPAVGWDHDFQSVSAVLNLPPGWRLITARGADSVPGTWFQNWTLLDFFIVLIVAIAVIKLQSWSWGVLALITLGLTYHEPGAPRLVWLNLLAASALLRVLPAGWFRRLAALWRLAAVVSLVVIALPFMLNQVRIGLYPQLEQVEHRPVPAASKALAPAPMLDMEQSVTMQKAMPEEKEGYMSSSRILGAKKEQSAQQALLARDPNALVQTGPGLPIWEWRSIPLRWNGPVERGQNLKVWLLAPMVNMVLAFVQIVLLALLIVGLVDARRWWTGLGKQAGGALVLAACLLLPGAAWTAESPSSALPVDKPVFQSGLFPPPALLQELEKRLLAPPDCLPDCAAINRMSLDVNDSEIRIMLEVHAQVETAVPLPAGTDSWMPRDVLMDDLPADGLARDADGALWSLIPPGVHRMMFRGSPPPSDSVQIPLPLRPHRVEFTATGWEVQGIKPDGRVEASIQLNRLVKGERTDTATAASMLPPFLHVERVLFLGLEWQVRTTVRRLTAPGAPIVASVPLMAGESVTTGGLTVENGRAMVNMDAKTREVSWTSTLNIVPDIHLTAPTDVPWTETWILDPSPLWHPEISGIPVIHHQDGQGVWRPEWQPWPGETVTIHLTRPQAVPGQIVTIEQADLDWTPGRRFDKAGLTLAIRSSQGGQHKIALPPEASLQLVRINDQSQPIGQAGREVVVPLQPGFQHIYLEWRQASGSAAMMRGPELFIGQQAVNAHVHIRLPADRWILWTSGPRLGPAVLFWTYLLVVVLVALFLGRIRLTPLKMRHWLLLGLGLTQIHPLASVMIAGWLFALGVRRENAPPNGWFSFDLMQLLIVSWTAAALIALYVAVQQGLLGIPDMQVAGNHSTAFDLYWTQDRIGAAMPQPLVISLPRLVFHLLMLAWSLWLAFSLLRWLRWGWHVFSRDGLWQKPRLRRKDKENKDFLIE